ncbi:competence/damage-inducible protein A [Aureisphaera galaxeae]|uniref:competence/damage-inducible protein A n=1 Tax=Aureisphaera galaxeae TaxID=1538023 RepID=UPI00235023B2|nr:competence/damage-inducible protein A [Aureisphaera galaxeae]MDC8005455.1 competence/damage-inducible protein A [Aureisphaera galaxeae]
MLAEIITIGDEILIGQIVDTNSAFISKELNKAGIQVYQITSVQDDREHILDALEEAKSRVDVVLVTGGLGPTKDDITKQTFCEFLDDTLVESAVVKEHIEFLFKKYFNKLPAEANLRQALVPSTAKVLKNQHGTAPGMWMEQDDTVFVSMPGVPYEMKALIKNEVIPAIIKKYNRPHIYHKTLLTYGLGESTIAERISDWEEALPKHIKLAYLPSLGKVRLRLSSKGENEEKLIAEVDAQMETLHGMVADIAVGYEDETSVTEKIGGLLQQKGKTLSLAESCTGGALAQEITQHPGASAFYRGSIIPYATELKTSILGVDADIIKENNVVSLPVAEAMAQQATKVFGSDYAIATTGIAGPTKGDGDDEVGTVCIAIATPEKMISEKFQFGKARERVIKKSVNKAFEMLLKEISKN